MDSSQLTTEQAAKIRDAIGPTVGYLCRLVRRMERRGFPPDDKLFKLATEAYDKMYHLSIRFDGTARPRLAIVWQNGKAQVLKSRRFIL